MATLKTPMVVTIDRERGLHHSQNGKINFIPYPIFFLIADPRKLSNQ